jgi:mono/diheme cytochrome c family protein
MLLALAVVSANCAGGDDPTTSGDPVAGRDLYDNACAWCHGFDMRGTERGPAHLSELYGPERAADSVFRAAIANGAAQKNWEFGPMAAVAGLSDAEVSDIIAYIRQTQDQQGLIPLPQPASG